MPDATASLRRDMGQSHSAKNQSFPVQPSDHYTATDVADWLSSREVAKAQSYLDQISDLAIAERDITAKVKGTAKTPYRVQITLAANGRNFPTRAHCSCPVGGYCKHVAATLLAAIDARSQVEPVTRVTPAALEWIEAIRLLASGPVKPAVKAKPLARLFWVLNFNTGNNAFCISCFKAMPDEDGRPKGKRTRWDSFDQALEKAFPFVDNDEIAIIRLLLTQRSNAQRFSSDLPLVGRHSIDILERLIDTKRFFFHTSHLIPLQRGPLRPAKIRWQQDERGRFCADAIAAPPATLTLPVDPPWFIDIKTGEMGELLFDAPAGVIARILAAPPLNEAEARLATTVLAEAAPNVPPPALIPARVIDSIPVPMLVLGSFEMTVRALRDYPPDRWNALLDVAEPGFIYDETVVFLASDTRQLITLPSGERVQVKRRMDEEAARLEELRATGMEPIRRGTVVVYPPEDVSHLWSLASESEWSAFMSEAIPAMQASGWRVNIPDDFRHLFYEVEEWSAEIAENESGWFDLDMGILVDGEQLALAPLLADLFHVDARWLEAKKLKRIANSELIDLLSPDGKRIRVLAERIKPLAQTLIDLFDGLPPAGSGKIRVAAFDAPRLMDITAQGWRTEGLVAVERMAKTISGLSAAGGVTPIAPPAGFALELRPYQREGLSWLQYLREHNLAGLLADDMGLGKTAQTLAHLLLEKEAGRLGGAAGPALIVLPTSLIFNWKAEVARFAPGLSVLSLQGKARKECFADIPHHDLVLTTYPLLWRDAKELAQHEYHSLILDEAQTVKNAASQGAAVVRQIKAKHRLCLTGTPLENHLGELWSQFDFLLPGFLGDAKSFTKTWRTPIEKHGNTVRAELLSRRIRPFILRRRKEDVAKELPPKTIIPRSVELEGGQRDLYEVVRSAMDKRVRDEIAAKGFARSQIIILDALLKLRQVCCDPRLVKSDAAKKVKERAKLDQLMGMLPELVDEGRKVLVFSQFTSMLALIEAELKACKLDYALLTGDTQDREAQIGRFQNGEVPIFLISLKAGGIGLNLTAADTVIHYDPWWNPAVENQATDRAHRLGQTKPVFVYKLIVAGSIEEKIVALQEQKAELARSILSADGVGDIKFSEADIRALLAPLPPAK